MSNGRLESLPLSPNGTNAFSGSALLMLSLSMWANLIPRRRPLYVLDAIQRQRVQWKVSLFEIQMLRRLCLGNMFLRRPLGPCLLLGSPTPTYMCPHLHMVYMASLHTLLPYPLTSHPNITPIHLKAMAMEQLELSAAATAVSQQRHQERNAWVDLTDRITSAEIWGAVQRTGTTIWRPNQCAGAALWTSGRGTGYCTWPLD